MDILKTKQERTFMTRNPDEAQIRKVMQETGMDYIQARNHLVCRYLVQKSLGLVR